MKDDPQFNQPLFCAAIHNKLRSDKLSLRQAAKAAGVSASTLDRCLNGSPPGIDTFCSIVRWLEADANTFLGQMPGEEKQEDTWGQLVYILRELGADTSLINAIHVILQAALKK